MFSIVPKIGGGGEFSLVYVGLKNSAELALALAKGSRVPAAHPHPKIPKETPSPREIYPVDNTIYRPFKQLRGQLLIF